MRKLKETIAKYGNYLIDFWQYLIIIFLMILAAVFILNFYFFKNITNEFIRKITN